MFFPNVSNRPTHSWSNLINSNTINTEFSNKSNLVYKLISNKSINLEIFLRAKHQKKIPEIGVFSSVFITSQKLFSFITPWNSLRRWIPNSFHFSLFNKHIVSIWKRFFPTDPWLKPKDTWPRPIDLSLDQTHNHRSPSPLPICNHQFEPRSNPQPLISTYTTTYLSPSLSLQTKSNPYRWWTTKWEREREREREREKIYTNIYFCFRVYFKGKKKKIGKWFFWGIILNLFLLLKSLGHFLNIILIVTSVFNFPAVHSVCHIGYFC